MERRTRRILFYSALLTFLLLGYGLVVFALGYKYDFVRDEFLKTGSFQIEANVSADVYVNDRLTGRTSFLDNSFTASRLLPRTYSVRVQSAGYQTWRKDIEINAGALVKYPTVVLLPQRFNEELVPDGATSPTSPRVLPDKRLSPSEPKTEREMTSPDGEKYLTFDNHEIWVKWLRDSGSQPFKKTGDNELITRFAQPVKDVQWHRGSSHVIADVGGILEFIEIDTRGGINIFEIAAAEAGFYYDKNQNAVYKSDEKDLIKINL